MKFGESLYWIIIILNILGGMIPYNHQPTECSEHCSNDSEISLERDLARSVCVACVFFFQRSSHHMFLFRTPEFIPSQPWLFPA